MIDGVPKLVVEILSPRDTQEQVDEKTDDYLQAGVALERSAGSRSDSARQQHRLSQDCRYIIPQSAVMAIIAI